MGGTSMPTFIVHMNPTFAAAKHPRSQVFEQVSLTAAEKSGNSSCRVKLRTQFSFLTRRLLLMYV